MDFVKLDSKALLQQAEMTGRIFRMKSGWRKAQIFAGLCCCFLILTIPLGIWIIIRAKRACIGLTEEGFAFTYLGTIAHRWEEVESITPVAMSSAMFGGGLVGVGVAAAVSRKTQGLKGPLQIKLRDKRIPKVIPAHTIENSMEMARQMEQLSGIAFLPVEVVED
ncbi:hypothetical protein JW921_06190 [Candidatus Fermentibacterales bacterium]|nr:hypothetical protein [Candidatus Fermentibacterales bacterium]